MGFDKRSSAKKYVPQDGDTLKKIAERETAAGNRLTEEELARFNFGTDDPKVVDELLRDQCGCFQRAEDKRFMFSKNVEPRSDLLIPVEFTKQGLAVDQTHVLRVKKVAAPPNQFEGCARIRGVTFEFDKSFIRPSVVDDLKTVEAELAKRPDAKVMIFGHTDKVGSEVYNKDLSDRRALSAFAFIIGKPDVWETLFQKENWGTKAIQEMLKDQGHDPGAIDGVDGPKTQAAVKEFQTKKGLPADGVAGPNTRKALFTDYMTGKHDIKIDESRFMDPKHMGCSEFNPIVDTEAAEEKNRRVMFYLFNKNRLPVVPCKHGDIGPCKKQMTPPAPRHRAAFKCSFYDSIAKECSNDGPPPLPVTKEVNPLITVATNVVVVKKPHTNPKRQEVLLKTDAPFDGTGTLTRSGTAIKVFTALTGGAEITFDGTDNAFAGDGLTTGVRVFAEGAEASAALDDFVLTLTLSGGTPRLGPPAQQKMTSVELTLDICMSRTAPGADPVPLSLTDKADPGRFLHVQDENFHHGRAMLIVRKAKPEAFAGTLSLTPVSAAVKVFNTADEVAATGQTALPAPHEVANGSIPADGLKLWAEAAALSTNLRDTGVRLGIKDVEPEGDRVNVTAMQFSNLIAKIRSTPANTARLGNSPVADQEFKVGTLVGQGKVKVGSFILVEPDPFDEKYTENIPLVLVEDSLPEANPVQMSVQVKPAGVPVLWSVQRDTRPAPDGDNPSVVSLSPSPIPTLTPDGGDPLKATLRADAVGSFRVRPFVDANANGTFEGDQADTGTRIDREPFILMNLVLIRVEGFTNNSRIRNNRVTTNPAPPVPAGFAAFTGVGATPVARFANPGVAAVHNDATVTVTGGGGDGRRGLDRVFGGWVNNETAVATSLTSPPGEDVVSEYTDATNPAAPVVHRHLSIWTSVGAGTTFVPGGPAPAIVPGPVLDVSPDGLDGAGGFSCVGTEGFHGPHPPTGAVPNATPFSARVTQTDQPVGQRWQIHMWDSPADTCPGAHAAFPGVLTAFRFNLDFRSTLVFWTGVLNTADIPANRLYSGVMTNTWQIRFDVRFTPAGAAVGSNAVTLTQDASATRRATPVEGSGVEVRHPTSLRLLATDART